MPTMDFSDVLTSPEFADPDNILVTQTTVDMSTGSPIPTASAPIKVSAIVVPGRASTLRAADGSRVSSFIDVYTRFSLTSGFKSSDTTSRSADIVTWHGRKFFVMAVEDYSAFGSGWIHASCDAATINPPV